MRAFSCDANPAFRFARYLGSFGAGVFLFCTTLFAANPNPPLPPLPELPEALKSITPTPLSHPGEPGAELRWLKGMLEVRLGSTKPLTSEQWDAVAALKPRAFYFNHNTLRDGDMDRLVAMDPVEIYLRINPLTGKGVAKFGLMKNLKNLDTHHMHHATPEAKEALANHPSLEYLRTAGDFCIDALHAPSLKSVELAEAAATVERVEELAQCSKIEFLSLYTYNSLAANDACMESVAKIETLKQFRVSFSELTYEKGLFHLHKLPNLRLLELFQTDLPDGDLERIKAAFPKVHVKHSPMKPDYRKKFDALLERAANGNKK
jgi:hypothetical protein